MPALDEVYRKFGQTSEAAQLLETELGNVLIFVGDLEHDLLTGMKPSEASDLIAQINAHTLGRLISRVSTKVQVPDDMESLLSAALEVRNRLSHSFYREHNFRRNSDEGRTKMLDDLESMHELIIKAYKAVLRISGIDLDLMATIPLPTQRVPI
jgi:hypothetical protein